MKKFIGIALVMLLAMGSGAFADTSVTDRVGVSYDVSGTVVLLGITGVEVNLSLNGGSWGATEAGAKATLGGGLGYVEKVGGWLHYTTYGVANQKITVEKDAESAHGYNNETLSVKINTMTNGGSALATLGTANAAYQTIGATTRTLITGISGTDTWTGTGATEGAQVIYKLTSHPGVSTVTVLYTILANS